MDVVADDQTARIAICSLQLPGDERIGQEVAQFGAVESVNRWLAGFGPKVIVQRISDAVLQIPRVLASAEKCGAKFITPTDADWPEQLSDLDFAAPIGLWVTGKVNLADVVQNSISVVGARAATAYGQRIASEIGTLAADLDQCVVSGAAFGIDASAHRGALAANGQTIAVLACGVDIAYPSAHQGLLERITASGAVVSEAPIGAVARKQNFLVRNRIIAALGRQTVVVEAALRSGALSTSNWANAIGRQVWGVPGPITLASSAGTNQEIFTGNAKLLPNPNLLFR